jgi:hypothetical protein
MICQFGFWLHHKIGKKKAKCLFVSLEERKVLFSVCFLLAKEKTKKTLLDNFCILGITY